MKSVYKLLILILTINLVLSCKSPVEKYSSCDLMKKLNIREKLCLADGECIYHNVKCTASYYTNSANAFTKHNWRTVNFGNIAITDSHFRQNEGNTIYIGVKETGFIYKGWDFYIQGFTVLQEKEFNVSDYLFDKTKSGYILTEVK